MMEADPPAGFFATADAATIADWLGYQYALDDLRSGAQPRKPTQPISAQIGAVAAKMRSIQNG